MPAKPTAPFKVPPTPANTVKPLRNEPLKAAESTNATAVVKSMPQANNTLTVKSVTKINGAPSVKAAGTLIKTAPKSTPVSKDVVKTIQPPAIKTQLEKDTSAAKVPVKKVTPAAKTAAEKVAPATNDVAVKDTAAAKTAEEKVVTAVKNTTEKVTPDAKTPAEKVTAVAKTPADKVTPAIKTPAETANTPAEIVTAHAKTAAEKVTADAKTPAEKVTAVAKSLAEKVTPDAKTAAEEVTQSVETPAKTPKKPDSNTDASPAAESKNKSKKTKESQRRASPEPEPLRRITPDIAQAISEELDEIMIKIWRKLPGEKLTPADRVVMSICDGADGKLRDMFTSNIKQRLLHVHNALYMNVATDRRPGDKWVSTFVKKFGVVSTRKMAYDQRSFVAELPGFRLFDKLYTFDKAKLGGVRVFLKPMYNFNRVPDDLGRLETRASTKLDMSSTKYAEKHNSSRRDESMDEDIDDESLDLFSLMKEGIVLDECMGSEDDEE